jgi:hypothetical protein
MTETRNAHENFAGKGRGNSQHARSRLKVKVKVKLSLYLTKQHAMKTYWGVEVQLHAFLTSATDGDEWLASRPGHFTPRERAPGTHRIECWASQTCTLTHILPKLNII